MESKSKHDHYGLARFRDSLFHFVFGKAFSAIASLIIVVTIIRQLEVAEYAVYATLHALVMFLRLLTSFGVNSSVLRFLPDLRVVGNSKATYAFLLGGIGLRAALYVAPVLLLYFLGAGWLSNLLSLGEWQWLLAWYLVVGFFRITATFTAGALESLLWQKQAQYSIAVATLLRLVGVFYLLSIGQFDLWTLVVLELVTETISLLLLITSGLSKWRVDPSRDDGNYQKLIDDAGRYANFSLWAYLYNLTTVLHGSAPNRLIVSAFLGTASTALFGAIDRLIQFVKQYEPVKLLLGLVRPVFNANFRSQSDFPKIMSMADGLFRLNFVVLMLPLLPCAVAGHYIFDIVSAGKYSAASSFFLGFYFVLVLGSFMMVLELIVKALELTKIFVLSNLAQSGSVLVALPFLPTVGLWALVAANVLGYLIAIGIVVRFLAKKKFPIRIRWPLIAFVAAAAAIAIVAGWLAKQFGLHEIPAIALAYLFYAVVLASRLPFTAEELSIGRQLLAKRASAHAH